MQVVAILAAGSTLPFSVESIKIDLPELQVGIKTVNVKKCGGLYAYVIA